jgi:histidinol-phosphate aminotransferase
MPKVILARRAVEASKPYVAPLEGRRGMLRLDFNETPVGPSPKVRVAVRGLPAEAYCTYPEYDGLIEHFAKSINVSDKSVALFNGVDAAIKAIFDAYGEPNSTFLTSSPTFGYYEPCAGVQGMLIQKVPHCEDLAYPLEDIRKEMTKKPKLLFICNPNNPTGTVLPVDDIKALARDFPETLLVVDELYADFTGVTILPDCVEYENIVVLRSLAKTQGIAALRVGFAISHPTILDRMKRVTGPYDINMFGVTAAYAAIDDSEHTKRYISEVLEAKTFTEEQLKDLGVHRVSNRGGNYMLVWPTADFSKVEAVVAGLKAKGILVRSMAGKPQIDGSMRVSIGTKEQMQKFIKALSETLKEL